MSGSRGVRWHCPSRECNWSFVATESGENEQPQCVCGKPMRRGDVVPVFSYLDFLRDGLSDEEALGMEKE